MDESKRLALEEIRAKNPHGMLVPSEVVDSARRKNSPLHDEFCWDNTKAADLYREQQARGLIRAVIMHEPIVNKRVRAYLSVPADRSQGGGYRPTREVLGRPDWVSQIMDEVIGNISGMRKRFAHIQQLAGLWTLIDRAVEEFSTYSQESAS